MENKVEPRTLPGFMELNPDDQVVFNRMMDKIRRTYEKYGFWPLDTPAIEYSEVLLAKAGGETEKQIYRFNKGDTDLSLRFDLTVPLAKYVAARYNELVFPFKRYQMAKVYRGERPQKGRFREFYQCDIDVIGDETLSLMYDAEIPSIIYDLFKELNIGDFVIRINNRKILSGFFDYLGFKDKITDILRIVDKIEKIGSDEVVKELVELDIDLVKVKKILEFISIKGSNEEKIQTLRDMNVDNETFNLGVEELEVVTSSLKSMNISEDNFEVDLTIARGLDYYTGTVYETRLKDFPNIGSVCSGGRFDNLAEYYTDKKLPGVGISIGLTRLFYQLKEAGIIANEKTSSSDVMIIPMTNEYNYVVEVAKYLRDNGISVNICYIDKNFKQKMRYADRSNVKYTVIIGEDEINTRTITIKNMEDSTQDRLPLDETVIKALVKGKKY